MMKQKNLVALLLVSLALFVSTFGQSPTPKTAEEFFNEGVALLRAKSFERALEAFEKSAALNAKQPSTFMNIGSVSMSLRRYEKAETAFRTAIKLDPAKGEFRAELCEALSLQRKHTEALAECDEAVRLDPNSERANIARLNAAQAARKSPESIQALADQLAARFRNSEMALVVAADASLLNRNFSYAVSLLESLVSLNPNVAMYHGLLAEAYLRVARDSESLASARTALRLDPDNPYGNYALGSIFFELGQHEEAVQSFEKVTTDEALFRFAKYYLAVSQSRRGKPIESVKILEKLIAVDSSEYMFFVQLAEDLSKLHRHREAIRAFLTANELRPNDVGTLSGLGLSYMAVAEFEKAISCFEQAFKQKPDNEVLRMFLGVARGRQHGIAYIPGVIREVEASPKDVKRRLDLVFILATSNRIDEAEPHIEVIYELNPDDPLVYHRISVAYSEAGRPDKALDAARRSLSKRETTDATLATAYLLAARGDVAGANTAFKRVFELKPDAPGLMLIYADHLRENGMRREALEVYKRSLALKPNNEFAYFMPAFCR